MLENFAQVFEHKKAMGKRMKQSEYEENMRFFRETYGEVIREMTSHMDQQEDKTLAAQEIGEAVASSVKETFAAPGTGKIKSIEQVDLNMFMIFYVFPAILLTEHPDATTIADGICQVWGKTFNDSKIRYLEYEKVHAGFKKKIFGLF